MRKLDKNALNWYIRQLLHLEKDIDIISDGSVTHLKVMGRDFYLYIKTVTYAGNPYPKNTTRAQLPRRDEFEAIKNSDAIFLFLGYDIVNEVFVCWEPAKTKERLNEKQYVSFFSRLNLQEEVQQGNILKASLQNDFEYVLFKLNDFPYFLLHIKDYFPSIVIENKVVHITEKTSGILSRIEDDASIKLLIEEQLALDENTPTLTLISMCMNEFGEFYHKMTLKDWNKLVNEYLDNRITDDYDLNSDYEEEAIDYDLNLDYEEGVMASDSFDEEVKKRPSLLNNKIVIDDDYSYENKSARYYIYYKDKVIYGGPGGVIYFNEKFYSVLYSSNKVKIDVLEGEISKYYISTINKTIVDAPFNSPLYETLDEVKHIDQIEEILYNEETRKYQVRVNGKWFDKKGNYVVNDVVERNLSEDLIPSSLDLSTQSLKEVFLHTSTTYKFYWFLSILQIFHRDHQKGINVHEIIIRMIANAWRPLLYYNMSFGSVDVMERIVTELQDKHNLSKEASVDEIISSIKFYSDQLHLSKSLETLTKNVPYRFLSPWISYTSDKQVINCSSKYENDCLYSIQKNGQWYDYFYIHINPKWENYLKENYNQLVRFVYKELASYLESKNPEVTDIYKKISGEITDIDTNEKNKSDKGLRITIASNQEAQKLKTGEVHYSLEDSPLISKNQLVFEVVKRFVDNHPNISWEDLEGVFPNSLNPDSQYGVIQPLYKVNIKCLDMPEFKYNFYIDKKEIITLKKGIKCVVNKEWGEHFDSFLKVASTLFNIREYSV